MTILIDPVIVAAFTALGLENDPLVAFDEQGGNGTITVTTGTAVTAPESAFTGTTFDEAVITPNGIGTVNIQIEFATAQTFEFAGMAAHNADDLSGILTVQFSTDSGATWTDSGAGGIASPPHTVGFRFAPKTAAFWRFRFLLLDLSKGDLKVGVLFLGNVLDIPETIYQGYRPPFTPTIVDLQSNVSQGAHLIGGAFTERGSTTTVDFIHLSLAFTRLAEWLGFQEHFNKGNGFFWAWRPVEVPDIFYASRSGPTIAPMNSGPGSLQSVSIGMRFHHE